MDFLEFEIVLFVLSRKLVRCYIHISWNHLPEIIKYLPHSNIWKTAEKQFLRRIFQILRNFKIKMCHENVIINLIWNTSWTNKKLHMYILYRQTKKQRYKIEIYRYKINIIWFNPNFSKSASAILIRSPVILYD